MNLKRIVFRVLLIYRKSGKRSKNIAQSLSIRFFQVTFLKELNMLVVFTIWILILYENIDAQRNTFRQSFNNFIIKCNNDTECIPRNECQFRNKVLSYCRTSESFQLKVCCPVLSKIIEETTTEFVSVKDCGKSLTGEVTKPLVMGGEFSEQGAWPWMVGIMRRDENGIEEPLCSGFLIDRKHVLSAAHCFDKEVSTPWIFSTTIGDVDLRKGRKFRVQQVVVHQNYTPGFYYDDIAMITLNKTVDIDTVNPICLPDKEIAARNLDGIGTTVAGWGAEKYRGDMTSLLKELHSIPVIPNKECNTKWKTKYLKFIWEFPKGITKGLLCAGFLEGGRDSCGGDSGAPLMLISDDRWYAVGIVSFGYTCGRKNFPAGYTRVSEYLNWIKEQAKN